MKCFIVLSALVAVALAKPGYLLGDSHHVSHVAPLTYAAPQAYVKLVPGAPIGHDGRVVDTPEVAHAKAEHAAAHVNEKITLAHESHNSADLLTYAAAPVHVATSYHSNAYAGVPVATSSYHGAHAYHAVAPVAYTKLVPAAPIGHDGRVVDTLEVAHAKAEHAAAHVNEKIALAHEAHNSADLLTYAVAPVATSYHSNAYASVPVATSSYHGAHAYHAVAPVAYTKLVPAAPIGHDGRVVDTLEVAHAKAEHAAAHVNEKVTLAHEGAKNSLYAAPQVQLVSAYSVGSYAPQYVSAHQW